MGAEIPDGAVLVARSIVNSSLWEMRAEDRVVALTCLALCNKRPKKWFDGTRDIMIERGQFVRSRDQMVKACKMPLQIVRTSVEHLEKNAFLTRVLTRAYTLYTIPKYEHYQDLTKYSDSGVRKLTQVLTRSQPSKTAKSNPAFQQVERRKYPDDQPVAEVLVNCGEKLTRENGKTNHKQQQQIPPMSLNGSGSPGRGDGLGGAVVVGVDVWPDPVLGKPSFRIASKLLDSVKLSDKISAGFAASKPVGQILRVVQQARLQKNPGGWARTALESDWWLPEASGDELREVIDLVKGDVERLNAYFLTRSGVAGVKMNLPAREPGEDDRTWMKRVTDELNRRKNGQRHP